MLKANKAKTVSFNR